MDDSSQSIDPSIIPSGEDAEEILSDDRHITKGFQGWSRRSEMGSSIVRLVLSASLTTLAVWLFSGWQTIHIAGMIYMVGIFFNALVAYPLVIASEKPDLGSPKMAVMAFFDSLEHHGPLYGRMWLLLTPEAQNCRSFSNFDGFRLYWKQKVKEWQHRAGAWPLTPVVINISDINISNDNTTATEVLFSCQISVLIRGRRAYGPVTSYDFTTTVVQNTNGNWYLATGDLPDALASAGQAGLPNEPVANGHSAG
ncbi:MAG: hypothetical protein ACKO5E_05720 [bacterium]